MILGIESSFDDAAACLVNSFGTLCSENVKYSLGSELVDDMGVDPKKAEKHHIKHLPLAIEKAMSDLKSDQKLKGIAVTIGPGQIA